MSKQILAPVDLREMLGFKDELEVERMRKLAHFSLEAHALPQQCLFLNAMCAP